MMMKRLVSLVMCLAIAAIAASPARADAPVIGTSMTVVLTGIPDDVYQCQSVSAFGFIELAPDGTSRRRTVVFTTWTDTPLGRVINGQFTRGLLPGQEYLVSIRFNSGCASAGSGGSYPVQVGITATVKGETLTATETFTFHDFPAPS